MNGADKLPAQLIWKDRRVTICRMQAADIEDIAGLYRETAIDRENYRRRLSAGQSGSFEKTGGMFQIQTVPSLWQLAENPEETVAVARDEAGEALACLWFASRKQELNELDGARWQTPALQEQILKQRDRRRLINGGEVIAAPGQSIPGLLEGLFLVMMSQLQARGFEGTCGEVYRVLEWRTPGETCSIDLFNRRSWQALQKTGAQYAGTLPVREIMLEGLRVTVEPTLVYWEIGQATQLLKQRLAKEQVQVLLAGAERERGFA